MKYIRIMVALLFVGGPLTQVSANSVQFAPQEYDAPSSTVSIAVEYDFTDFAMFGGGLDLYYDTASLVFISYTQAELQADAQAAASPVGALSEPGFYEGFGIGTFEFFNGMTSAGTIGTFVFEFIGASANPDTPCGEYLCLTGNSINPFVSLAGEDVTDMLLASPPPPVPLGPPVPVPAAIWMMLGALGAVAGFGRKTA